MINVADCKDELAFVIRAVAECILPKFNFIKTLSKILCKWKQDSVVSSPYI